MTSSKANFLDSQIKLESRKNKQQKKIDNDTVRCRCLHLVSVLLTQPRVHIN